MKEDTTRRIQVAANVAIIVTAVLLCSVLIKNYIISNPGVAKMPVVPADRVNRLPNRTNDDQPQFGAKVNLPGVDWAKNGQTLLLVLSSKCHFCSESAPFYQRVTKRHGNTQLIAVLPQSVEDGKKYLDSLNVPIDEIKQVSMSSLGIRGTPTLVLVDRDGEVMEAWIGKLDADQEAAVLNSLKAKSVE